MAAADNDDATLESIVDDASGIEEKVGGLEFRRMFARPAPAAPRRRTGPPCCCGST